jgi:hypothetical protein
VRETEACKTTTDNYADRLEGEGFGTLPQLFQDIFAVAETLEVRYVWIDSICIIQDGDDGQDWRSQAVKMAEYYQLSLLTIAGTNLNMNNGLLSPSASESLSTGEPGNTGEPSSTSYRIPWENKLAQLPYRDETGTQSGVFYAYRRKARLVDDYWALVRGSHLFSRGWILQEWLLSMRVLWYTQKGLFFECRTEGPRTECGEKIELDVAQADMKSHLQLKASFNSANKSILDFWYNILEVYSACDLSKPGQDRMLAVAGLAKEVRKILRPIDAKNEFYLSGMWFNDLHRGLLWEEHHASTSWTRRVDGMPSWSWASLMTQVRWPKSSQGVKEAFRLTGICMRRPNRHEKPDYAVQGKQILQAFSDAEPDASAALLQSPSFDSTNIVSCLHIRGRLATVHVRGYLETEEKLNTAAFFTAYGTTVSPRWRAICSPARPEIIAGWGSLERLGPSAACADFGVAVHALHVSTRYLRTGLLIKRADPVIDVLFLEKTSCGAYSRLGIGRIADEGLIAEFGRLKDEDVQLI